MSRRLLRDFIRYVSLNVVGTIGLSCYILADTYFIANGIGLNGLTALNLAIPVFTVISGIGLMLGIGGATRYKIARAGNTGEDGNKLFSVTARFGLLLGLLFVLLGVAAAESIARGLGANGDTLSMTASYLKTILCFAPCFILNNILIAFVRNDGSPRTAAASMLSSSLSNILLDYVFIFPLDMGMLGAALATGFSPIISMTVMSPYFLKGKNQFHLQRKSGNDCRLWFHICSLGVSAFISEIASSVILLVFNFLLLRLGGNIAVAAYSIVANMAFIVSAIFNGMGQGMQPLVSHCYGVKAYREMYKLLHYAILLSLIVAATSYMIILAYGRELVGLFNREHDETLDAIATDALRVYFTGFFFAAVNMTLATYFSAIDQSRYGFLVSVLRGVVLVVPLAIVLAAVWQIKGVWLVFPTAEALCLIAGIWMSRAVSVQIETTRPSPLSGH